MMRRKRQREGVRPQLATAWSCQTALIVVMNMVPRRRARRLAPLPLSFVGRREASKCTSVNIRPGIERTHGHSEWATAQCAVCGCCWPNGSLQWKISVCAACCLACWPACRVCRLPPVCCAPAGLLSCAGSAGRIQARQQLVCVKLRHSLPPPAPQQQPQHTPPKHLLQPPTPPACSRRAKLLHGHSSDYPHATPPLGRQRRGLCASCAAHQLWLPYAMSISALVQSSMLLTFGVRL